MLAMWLSFGGLACAGAAVVLRSPRWYYYASACVLVASLIDLAALHGLIDSEAIVRDATRSRAALGLVCAIFGVLLGTLGERLAQKK